MNARLNVNIDHVATVRQARRAPEPSIVAAAMICEQAGADGITVHLRGDRRHIQDADIRLLREAVRTYLNVEMAATEEMVKIAVETKPDAISLVPETAGEITTEGGLDVRSNISIVRAAVSRLRGAGIMTSLFIDPDPKQIRAAADTGAQFIELHTGAYANHPGDAEIKKLIAAADLGHKLGLRVNAGHGLNYENTPGILAAPHLETLNTGHSIISRAVFVGLRQAVHEMLALMNP